MASFEPTQTVPLTRGEDGTIRIIGSRVTLDCVIDGFKQGATAEQIQGDFPSLTLRQVYGTVAYYLEHTEQWRSIFASSMRKARQRAGGSKASKIRPFSASESDSGARSS